MPWWPPVLAWLAATGLVLGTCVHYGYPPFAPISTWARHDALNYLQIARSGYNLTLCTRLHPPILVAKWCGNAGWFPAYPWLLHGLHYLGLQYDATAILISWLASLATLLVLWGAFLLGQPVPAAVPRRGPALTALGASLALCYAAFAPGLVYNYGEFPLSLVTLGTVCSFALAHRGHWMWAGLAAAVAALAYPVGLAVAPSCGLWALAEPGARVSRRLSHALAATIPAVVAVALFLTTERLQTGHWDAYLLVQQRFHHRLGDPFIRIVQVLRAFAHSPFVLSPSYSSLDLISGAAAIESLLVAFVVVCTLTELLLRRGPDLRNDALIGIWAVLAWVLLWVASGVDAYRGDLALMPIAVLVRRLPWPLAALITAVAVVLAVPMTDLYLKRSLI
jgi:hypothetical protein